MSDLINLCPYCRTAHAPHVHFCTECLRNIPEGQLMARDAIPPIGPPPASTVHSDLETLPCPACGVLTDAQMPLCSACGAPLCTSGAATQPAAKPTTIEAGATFRGWQITESMRVTSAEADLWRISKEGSEDCVLKLYRYGFAPKSDVVEALRSMGNRHLVTVLETGEHGGRYYEIQEFIRYGSLADHLTGKPLDDDQAREVLREVSEAIEHLHGGNIRHRDLKPSNVLIRSVQPLHLVLTDFGIASLTELSLHVTAVDRTPAYSAPETLTGVVTSASDWWSLGMVMFEVVTGKRYFAEQTEIQISFQLSQVAVAVPSDIAEEWQILLKGLLTRDYARRWRAEQVKAWLNGQSDIPLYFESNATAEHSTGNPYRFAGEACHTPQRLAMALARKWQEGRQHVEKFAPQICAWAAELKDCHAISKQLEEIAGDTELNAEGRFAGLLMAMDPALPPFMSGERLTREWIAAHPTDAVSLLESSFPDWMIRLRQDHWLGQLRETREQLLLELKAWRLPIDRNLAERLILLEQSKVIEQANACRDQYVYSAQAALLALLQKPRLSHGEAIILLATPPTEFATETQASVAQCGEHARLLVSSLHWKRISRALGIGGWWLGEPLLSVGAGLALAALLALNIGRAEGGAPEWWPVSLASGMLVAGLLLLLRHRALHHVENMAKATGGHFCVGTSRATARSLEKSVRARLREMNHEPGSTDRDVLSALTAVTSRLQKQEEGAILPRVFPNRPLRLVVTAWIILLGVLGTGPALVHSMGRISASRTIAQETIAKQQAGTKPLAKPPSPVQLTPILTKPAQNITPLAPVARSVIASNLLTDEFKILHDADNAAIIVEFQWLVRFGARRSTMKLQALDVDGIEIGAPMTRGPFNGATRVNLPVKKGWTVLAANWEINADAGEEWNWPAKDAVEGNSTDAITIYTKGQVEAHTLVAHLRSLVASSQSSAGSKASNSGKSMQAAFAEGFVMLPTAVSKNGQYGVVAPDWEHYKENQGSQNLLVNARTSRVMATLPGETWVEDPADPGKHRNSMTLQPQWSEDGSTLAWVLGGKWFPAAFGIVKTNEDSVEWQLDVMKSVQQAILSRTKAAAPKHYEAAREHNKGNGRSYPDGFTIDVDTPKTGFSLPFRSRITLTSNPKQMSDWPETANVRSSMNVVISETGDIQLSAFKLDLPKPDPRTEAVHEGIRTYLIKPKDLPKLKQPVIFQDRELSVSDNIAYFSGCLVYEDGSDPPIEIFGDVVYALFLRLDGNSWRVIFDLSFTDVPNDQQMVELRKAFPKEIPESLVPKFWKDRGLLSSRGSSLPKLEPTPTPAPDISAGLGAAEAFVRNHLELEARRDWNAVIGNFTQRVGIVSLKDGKKLREVQVSHAELLKEKLDDAKTWPKQQSRITSPLKATSTGTGAVLVTWRQASRNENQQSGWWNENETEITFTLQPSGPRFAIANIRTVVLRTSKGNLEGNAQKPPGGNPQNPAPVAPELPAPLKPGGGGRRFNGKGTVYKTTQLKDLAGQKLSNAWLYGCFVYRSHAGNTITAVNGTRILLAIEGTTEVQIECAGGFTLRNETVEFFRTNLGQPPAPVFDIPQANPLELLKVETTPRGRLRVFARFHAGITL